ncbi:MAG: endonuclease MutS2, partial [Muribaculaceae bacterium]|nr:endonuclease MutS2 [Muribaculaceae bacterium]
MIYPDGFEKKVGFDAVRRAVADACHSPMGREQADGMRFAGDFATVSLRLRQTAEMLALTAADSDFQLGPIHDMRAAIRGIRVAGSFMPAQELMQLRAVLETAADLHAFFARHRDDEGHSDLPALDTLALQLVPMPETARAIDRLLDRWGNVRDNASPELTDIRRALASMNGVIAGAMRRVMARAVQEGWVDADVTPAVRDGRLVVPVAPANKRRIPGIVHDESASGKTVFIEPAEIVEANNRLRELQMRERREVTRLLIGMADNLRPDAPDMLADIDLLGEIDFIHAKAAYAMATDAHMPSLAEGPAMEWYHACHPVLQASLERQGKHIVPLDITLSEPDSRILVISGPNAGGKSVTLKTAGIIQYMTQCGLLPPVYENSRMGIFDSIFIDIGDDQSIEDDLSTYSSHLRNMKYFLAHGNTRTLMLIDEFGAGTEPQIGGAIAQAILRQYNAQGMWGIVTTHFQNLKHFAEDTPGLVNGSMLYDRQLMQPQFRLLIGHPGSSFAVEIARKTGLPEAIIDDAEQIVGSDYVNLDKYLLDITRDKRYWENKRADIRRKEKRLEETLARYEADADNLRSQRREIIADARAEARRILESSNAAIERTIHDIRRAQADREATLEARRRLAEEREH